MTAMLALCFASLHAAIPDTPSVVTRGARRFILFVSCTDATRRAEVFTVTGAIAGDAWERAEAELVRRGTDGCWLRAAPTLAHLLDDIDVPRFYRALHHRAHYLLACEARGGFAHERGEVGVAVGHWTATHVERTTGGRWTSPPDPGLSASGLCVASMTTRYGDMVAVWLAEREVGVSEPWLARLPHTLAAMGQFGRRIEDRFAPNCATGTCSCSRNRTARRCTNSSIG